MLICAAKDSEQYYYTFWKKRRGCTCEPRAFLAVRTGQTSDRDNSPIVCHAKLRTEGDEEWCIDLMVQTITWRVSFISSKMSIATAVRDIQQFKNLLRDPDTWR